MIDNRHTEYLSDETFTDTCLSGNIELVKDLASLKEKYGTFNIHANNESAFINSCLSGNIKLVKYLISLKKKYGPIDIHANNESAFINSCTSGNIKLVKYLISLKNKYGPINIHANNDMAFINSCLSGNIKLVKYLISLEKDYGPIDIRSHIKTNNPCSINHMKYLSDEAFTDSCLSGNIGLVKDLVSLKEKYGQINIHANNELAFINSCRSGNLELVKYLISLEEKYGQINIHADKDMAFINSCRSGNTELVKYLISLEEKYGTIDIHRGYDKTIPSRSLNSYPYGSAYKKSPYYSKKDTAFKYACQNNLDLVKYLISLRETHGLIDIHSIVYRGNTRSSYWSYETILFYSNPFIEACTYGKLEIAQYLMELEKQEEYKYTNDYVEYDRRIRIYSSDKADDLKVSYDSTLCLSVAIRRALMNEHLDICDWLMSTYYDELDLRVDEFDTFTIMHDISHCRNIKIFELLLKYNPIKSYEHNSEKEARGAYSLFDAAISDNNEIMFKFLLDNKYTQFLYPYRIERKCKNEDEDENNGNCHRYYAGYEIVCRENKKKLIKILLDHGYYYDHKLMMTDNDIINYILINSNDINEIDYMDLKENIKKKIRRIITKILRNNLVNDLITIINSYV